jgi:hypothetical protein
MTEHEAANESRWARRRERRRVKRQQALELEFHQAERLDPGTRAYTDADHHARRWSAYLGGDGAGGWGDGGGGGGDGGGGG